MQKIVRHLLLLIVLIVASVPALADEVGTDANPFKIYILNFRGCEEICQAFKEYVESQNVPAQFIERSVDRDSKRVPEFVAEIRQMHPDLVVTWGTSVTSRVVGEWDAVNPLKHITDIPVVYLNVGDPVGSKIAKSTEFSGRPNVAGGNVDPPILAQLRAIQAYRPVKRLGVIYGADEENSILNVEQLKAVLDQQHVELVEARLPLDPATGKPGANSIASAIAEMKDKKPDFVYYIANTYLLLNIGDFTRQVSEAGMPMFAPYELPVTQGYALYGMISSNRNVGQVGGYQAVEILLHKKDPATLPSPTLSVFTTMINMKVARDLEFYPPMKLIEFAELFDR